MDSAVFLPFALGVFKEESNYVYVCITLGAIFPVLRVLLNKIYVTDTPLYYLRIGNEEKAKDVLSSLYPLEGNLIESTEEYNEIIEALVTQEQTILNIKKSTTKITNASVISEEEEKNYKKPQFLNKVEILAFFLWFWNQFTGIQAVNSYSHDTFSDITSESNATLITVALAFLGFVANISSIFYIGKVSRKNLLVVGGLGSSICLYLISLSGYYEFVIGTIILQIVFRMVYT